MSQEPYDIFGLHAGSPLTGDYSTYAAEVGNVIWAWNHLHAALGDNFWLLTGIEDPVYPRSIWHSFRSDSGQRNMLSALVLTHLQTFANDPEDTKKRQFHHALEELVLMLKEVDHISKFRNDVTHTLWTKEHQVEIDYENYSLPKAVPDTERGDLRGKKMEKRLQGKDTKLVFRTLANYSFELAQYCRFIDTWLSMWDDSETFPDKPKRPSILE